MPATRAHVVVIDPKDNTKWETDAGPDGKYEIKRALLHVPENDKGWPLCPKFKISAEYEGDRVDDTYEGPLKAPDRNAEHTKDLTIKLRDRWNVELTFTKTVAGQEQLGEGGLTRQVGGSYSATVKAVVEYVRSQGSDRIFESKSAELDLNDTFWQHLVLQANDLTCEGRISWTGTHNGKIQVPVIMRIHTKAKRCSFGFGRPGGDPITYKMAVNLWGDDRCGGARAWNGESQVKDALFSADGIDAEHLPKPIPFSPGQKEVSGQDQWNSTLWLVRSWGALSVPMEQFPALWRPMVGLLKASSLISKKIPANMNLSWKATKLGQ
jgi:hypothetical protein